MADLSTGADSDCSYEECFGCEEYNDLKNHWRQSDPCANLSGIVAGMITSDEDDDRLYHCYVGALESGGPLCYEIVQFDHLYTSGQRTLNIWSDTDTDRVSIYHDESHAYFRTTDGAFIFLTDEGVDTTTYVQIRGKGTGGGQLAIYDQDNAEYLQFYCWDGIGYISTIGASASQLRFQDTVAQNIIFYGNISAGNPGLYIYGWDAGSVSLKYGAFNIQADGYFRILAEEAMQFAVGASTIFYVESTRIRIRDNYLLAWGDNEDGSLEYDETTNDALIFGIPVSPKRGLIFCDKADIAVDFTGIITASAFPQLYVVDSDNDSVFVWGFYADDVGILTVPANPLHEQIIINSGFGTWSESNANKGIGYLDFDSGSVAPVVGETLTGATSGAVGVVMWFTVSGGTWGGGNASGTIYLGACSTACFNDDENVNGSVGGANIMTVNQPDGAVGTDGLISNGPFVHNVDPPNDWVASASCLPTTEAGGHIGNCCLVTNNGDVNQYVYQICTTEIGKIYKFSGYAKAGTAVARIIVSSAGPISADYGQMDDTIGVWAQKTLTFEATNTTTYITLRAIGGDGTDAYFDEICVYEITPGCYGTNDNVCDGWYKDTTVDAYREHSNEETTTKRGSFYSLKIVPSSASDFVMFPTGYFTNEEWAKRFRGKTVSFGCWVLTNEANHCRLSIYDDGHNYSSYHSGGGSWEWLEVTATVSTTASSFRVYIYCVQAGQTDGTTIIYVSQPMLVFGSSIGEGNYRPIAQEMIWMEKFIQSNELSNTTQSDTVVTDLNVEADSDAMLPKGCKCLHVFSNCRDSGSAGNDTYLYLQANSTIAYEHMNSLSGLANDSKHRFTTWQACDENGDIQYEVEASGASTFDILELSYKAVQVN